MWKFHQSINKEKRTCSSRVHENVHSLVTRHSFGHWNDYYPGTVILFVRIVKSCFVAYMVQFIRFRWKKHPEDAEDADVSNLLFNLLSQMIFQDTVCNLVLISKLLIKEWPLFMAKIIIPSRYHLYLLRSIKHILTVGLSHSGISWELGFGKGTYMKVQP